MSIWHYENYNQATIKAEEAYQSKCTFCNTLLIRDKEDEEKIKLYETLNYGLSDNFKTSCEAVIGICPICGWWKYGVGTYIGGSMSPSFEMRVATLKKLDLHDISIPLGDIRSYLAAKYESRFKIHPRIFEEVVASVFRDHGFSTKVTTYSGDGGIDIILDGKNDKTIGVQVKRYKNSISVSQIRELTGALILNGLTKGIFVTTSEFQEGVHPLTDISAKKGYPIELIDATKFFEKLKIAQLSSYEEVIEKKPWGNVREWS